MGTYDYQTYDVIKPRELDGQRSDAPVVIVGAGPIGLAAAIDLALQGIKSIVVDDNNVVSVGSRAICWAKRSLEIFDRLGVGQRMLEKGVTWQLGRVHVGDEQVYTFDLLPEAGHQYPAFINLQQYYVEQYLIERCADFPDLIEIRFKNKVVAVRNQPDQVELDLETPFGDYTLDAQWLIACDGAKSFVRESLGLQFNGQVFDEQFLIADIKMEADFPSERWFWFMPTFHPGQSALLHKQPDNIYRIDLQLGADADVALEKQPERVIPRIKNVVGDRPFELDWVSVYQFRCAKLDRFVHDRVIFAGDSAHVVSPFGARGGNGGIHDIDNLCWKLARVVRGEADVSLIETYNQERVYGSEENIRNSTWTTQYMSPETSVATLFRDAVLDLAKSQPFARKMVNAGRLSVPCVLEGFSLQTASPAIATVKTGQVCPDAPLSLDGQPQWLLPMLGGSFKLLCVGCEMTVDGLESIVIGDGGYEDTSGKAAKDFGRGVYLIRPDQHVAAQWVAPSEADVLAALARAGGEQC